MRLQPATASFLRQSVNVRTDGSQTLSERERGGGGGEGSLQSSVFTRLYLGVSVEDDGSNEASFRAHSHTHINIVVPATTTKNISKKSFPV